MVDLTGSNRIPTKRTAVALGLFDGLHLGHQSVIHRAVDFIPEGLSPAVFTFETGTITSKGNGTIDVILTRDLKHEMMEKLGVEYIYSPDFLNFRELTGQEFVELVLRDKFHAKYVICGKDFRFGKGAFCGVEDLAEMGAPFDIHVILIEPTLAGGEKVSSTKIRQFIKAGEIREANRFLGYDFQMRLPVIYGHQLGRTLNFPTINQQLLKNQVLPRFGVYSTVTEVDGILYRSVTNVGIKPTVESDYMPLAETHIIGYEGDLYGKNIRVSFRDFVRPEVKFESIEQLKEQVHKDIEFVKKIQY